MTKEWILPEVKAEIEARIKHQRQHEEEKQKDEFFSKELLPRYALIDAALWGSDIDSLLLSDAVYRSLFKGEQGEQLQTVAPYLVDLHLNEEFANKIKQNKSKTDRRVMWLHSELSIDDLRKHLRHFLRMKTESGAYIYSRFYDPYVANCVFPNLTEEQLKEFFAPIDYVITEDVRINERRVFYLSADNELKIKYQPINHVDNK
jgi:hypothetical protein